MSPTPDKRLQKIAGLKKVTVQQNNPKGAALKAAHAATAQGASEAAHVSDTPKPKKKVLPAKTAAKKAAQAPKKPTKTPKVSRAQSAAVSDDQFMEDTDAKLASMGKDLLVKRQQMFDLAANGQEEYAGKGEDPTEYETVQQAVFDLEDAITRALGVPESLWDIDDEGTIGWDEEALDDDMLFNDDGSLIEEQPWDDDDSQYASVAV